MPCRVSSVRHSYRDWKTLENKNGYGKVTDISWDMKIDKTLKLVIILGILLI